MAPSRCWKGVQALFSWGGDVEYYKVRLGRFEGVMQPHLARVCLHKGVDARKTLQTQSCCDQLDALFARPESLGAAEKERRHSVMLLR
jgi:hypothetical protein